MKIDIENLPSESNILQQIIAELSTENHSLLYEKEAHIIAQAGRPGMITIATNMAGRGTDIVLGGC